MCRILTTALSQQPVLITIQHPRPEQPEGYPLAPGKLHQRLQATHIGMCRPEPSFLFHLVNNIQSIKHEPITCNPFPNQSHFIHTVSYLN